MGTKGRLVYTVITGDYDTLRPIQRERGFDYVCFTDNPLLSKNGWDLEIIEKSDHPLRQQRLIKVNSHLINYPLTVYMDANFRVIRPISELIDKHYNGGFLTCLHNERTLVSQEMEKVLEVNKCTKINIDLVRWMMERNSVPDDCGMYATGFIIRDKSEQVRILEKKWADLILVTSHRDQLTLGPASYITGTKIDTIARRELVRYAILKTHIKHENPLLKPV